MLSKCANPACPAQFRNLHQGKLFRLCPSPEVDAITGGMLGYFYERFWLCEKCCKQMKVVWDGTKAALAPLSTEGVEHSAEQDYWRRTRPIHYLGFVGRDIG